MLLRLLQRQLRQAVSAVLPDADLASVQMRPAAEARFGDYQSNALMALAKARKMNPRQLATEVVAKLDVTAWCEPVEIAGAGFLNFRLKTEAIVGALREAAQGGPLFFEKATAPRTIIVDFSSPNIAKPMHVGHIRSTVLGDALARTLRLLGHRVITDNHIGDWGTQFGKLLAGWKTILDRAALQADPIGEMERIYKQINQACETNPATLETARQELVKLQAGDAENLGIWREMIALSESQFERIYTRLGVKFDYTLGESFYNPRLRSTVDELAQKGIAIQSEGALVAFFAGNPELKDHPAIVQKSDGGFNYATTDLATLQYRVEGGSWGGAPDEIIYVTGGPQQLHFKQVFDIYRRWHPEVQARLAHVWFGSVLGEDGKPFKTRSGETVRLEDLLDEAEERALQVVTQKNPDLSESERKEIARVVGLGAIKYADLAQNRQSDYVFSWDKMLALQGNTAPYLLYSYTRVKSIFRKDGERSGPLANLVLSAPEEFALARHMLNFGLALEATAEEHRPNYLCAYLFELSGHFARFYEACPVLKADGAVKQSRLTLCDLTARVLRQGLEALGIETTEQM
ncbi:MAG TPA: arginine--tRNA ligase [Verrucomicrobiae bacterium]|nr:arginine--tRNA ligase [Verrucomicrobiae bacterium]